MTKNMRKVIEKQRRNKIRKVCETYSINNAIKFLKQDFGMTKDEAKEAYNKYC